MSTNEWKVKTGYMKKYAAKYRKLIVEYYGNECANCGRGCATNTKLVVDHVYNDGRDDRYGSNKGYTGAGYYKRLWEQIEDGRPDRFQLLCYKCHAQKHLSRVAHV